MKIRYFSAHINAFSSAIAGGNVEAGRGADGCVNLKDAVVYLVFGLVNAEGNGNELC